VVSYYCSNIGMHKCCDPNFSYGGITVYVRGLVLIVCMKRESATALIFIVPVKDLFVICVLVVIFLVKVVCKSIEAILKIYILIAVNHNKCY